jgi:tRNA threonylcarbamoyladenosine dehydratase
MQSPLVTAELRQSEQGADLARRFAGVERLYGAAAFAAIQRLHVLVVGIGGVGSWAVEALARSGVGALTLVDLDHIAESNTNRQIHALGDEYGKAKVVAMRERVVAINPACRVITIEAFADADNAAALVAGADALIDCADQVRAKAALLAAAVAAGRRAVTCGAAGGRIDPTRIRVADLAQVAGDPLLAKTRQRLRSDYGFARGEPASARPFGLAAVYSDEPVARPQGGDADAGLSCSGYGSAVTVTAPMGFAAAAELINHLARSA